MTNKKLYAPVDFSKKMVLIALGRQSKAIATAYREDKPGMKAAKPVVIPYNDPVQTRNIVMSLVAQAMNEIVKDGFKGHIAVYTLPSVAIKAYQFFNVTKETGFDPETFDYTLLDTKLQNISDEQKDADREAHKQLAMAIFNARENNCAPIFNSYTNGTYIDVNVPENTDVADGQVLEFKDGETENGITAIGYKTLSGKHAMSVRMSRGVAHYSVLRAEDGKALSNSFQNLNVAIRDVWNQLPKRSILKENGSWAELAA